MEEKSKLWIISAIVIVMLIFILPGNFLSKLPDFPFRDFIVWHTFNLWLDLKWWTHLNYKVDLSKAEKNNSDNDSSNDVNIKELVEWIRTTLEKRVNGLWVAEPNIYISKAWSEQHIIVELAWVTDIEEAKAIVWKTIQLEFKELRNEWEWEAEEKALVKTQADWILEKALKAPDFATFWNSVSTKDKRIVYSKETTTQKDLTWALIDIWDMKSWEVVNKLYDVNLWKYPDSGYIRDRKWFLIVKPLEKTGSWDSLLAYEQIFIMNTPSIWKDTGLDWSNFKRAKTSFDNAWNSIVNIEFDSEWWTLFWKITWGNIWKPIAIFVWWALISAPMVNEEILWWSAQISWNFSIHEATALKNDLNTWAIWAPVILSGQHQVEASLWAESLAKSINAWLWWVLALIIFMVFKYRILGLFASIALLMYSIILLFILKYSWIIWAPIVLTLAWLAWIVLSIWMAVDANILIFERTKEEINDWKNMLSAVSIWFSRAWSSIRDSNFSSLITCFILIWFWTSMIRWFAINLSIWIIISMFTAITVTRTMLFVFLPKMSKGLKKFLY